MPTHSNSPHTQIDTDTKSSQEPPVRKRLRFYHELPLSEFTLSDAVFTRLAKPLRPAYPLILIDLENEPSPQTEAVAVAVAGVGVIDEELVRLAQEELGANGDHQPQLQHLDGEADASKVNNTDSHKTNSAHVDSEASTKKTKDSKQSGENNLPVTADEAIAEADDPAQDAVKDDNNPSSVDLDEAAEKSDVDPQVKDEAKKDLNMHGKESAGDGQENEGDAVTSSLEQDNHLEDDDATNVLPEELDEEISGVDDNGNINDADEPMTEAEEREAKLEAYKTFVAEQESKVEIDYAGIRVNIEANALPSRMYFIMNALSAIIAGYGLVINSPAVVIGAMLVAMMLGPITGVALAIIDYRIPFLRRSLFTVLAGGGMVIVIGFIIGLLHHDTPLSNEILSRTQPTSMDLMIALAGGTAGAYAMISPHLSVAVVGVAVATALVPPLAASGILFAHGEGSLGFGALLLAITNIIAIQFTNALVLWFSGFRRLMEDDFKTNTHLAFLRRNAVPLVLLTGIGIYLSINLNTIASKQAYENDVRDTISTYFEDKGNVLTATQFLNRANHQSIRAVIRGETRPSTQDARNIEEQITQKIDADYPDLLPVHLQLRYLPVVVIDSSPEHSEEIDATDAAILAGKE